MISQVKLLKNFIILSVLCLFISIFLEYSLSSVILNNLLLSLAGHRDFFVNLFLGLFASCLVALITSIILFLQEFNQIIETTTTIISSLITNIEVLNSIKDKYITAIIYDKGIIEDDMDYVIDILELIRIDSNKLLLNPQLVLFITNGYQILSELSLLNKKSYYYRYELTKDKKNIQDNIVNKINQIISSEINLMLKNKKEVLTSYKKLLLIKKIKLIKEFKLI